MQPPDKVSLPINQLFEEKIPGWNKIFLCCWFEEGNGEGLLRLHLDFLRWSLEGNEMESRKTRKKQ